MVGNLLLRGMLVGIVAGLLAFGFLKVAGEPSVDRAIAFEAKLDEAKTEASKADAMPGMAMPADEPEPELVSRPTQAGVGLFTGVVVYGTALGGLFALAYAFMAGRLGPLGPRAVSAVVAGCGFVAVCLIPTIKYPANPPSVGDPGTIGTRTAIYFAMIAISLAAAIAAGLARGRLARSLGDWNATLVAVAGYLVAVGVVAWFLPVVDEVPDAFPAVVLWQFRIASLGAQLLVWATLGLLFGALTERAARSARRTRVASAAA